MLSIRLLHLEWNIFQLTHSYRVFDNNYPPAICFFPNSLVNLNNFIISFFPIAIDPIRNVCRYILLWCCEIYNKRRKCRHISADRMVGGGYFDGIVRTMPLNTEVDMDLQFSTNDECETAWVSGEWDLCVNQSKFNLWKRLILWRLRSMEATRTYHLLSEVIPTTQIILKWEKQVEKQPGIGRSEVTLATVCS